jgi:hypothetical protein
MILWTDRSGICRLRVYCDDTVSMMGLFLLYGHDPYVHSRDRWAFSQKHMEIDRLVGSRHELNMLD